jgi:hypothetical protein
MNRRKKMLFGSRYTPHGGRALLRGCASGDSPCRVGWVFGVSHFTTCCFIFIILGVKI